MCVVLVQVTTPYFLMPSKCLSMSQNADVALPPAVHDGSITPAEEMGALLAAYRSLTPAHSNHEGDTTPAISSSAGKALQQAEVLIRESLLALRRIVDMLITTGGTNAHYRKAKACLKVKMSHPSLGIRVC